MTRIRIVAAFTGAAEQANHHSHYFAHRMATLPIGPHRVEEMLTYSLDLARKMLEANGAFSPFGVILDASGKRRPVMAEPEENKTTTEAYQLIAHNLRLGFERGEIIAGVIVAIASVPKELKPDYPDGVRINVESATISRLVFLPFAVDETPKQSAGNPGPYTVQYGELLGVNVKPSIFVRPPKA